MAELAREVWRNRELAERLDREAEELRRRFNETFWIEERNGYYALALDAQGNKVDSLCSNIGHLLWSGIVPPERVDAIVDHLMGDALWSGWGVRTMSSDDRAYNPLAYHNGTIWPHDNSLMPGGWRATGAGRAQRIVRQMLTAGRHFDYQLPRSSPACHGRRRAFRSPTPQRRGRRPGRRAPPCSSCSCCSGSGPTGVETRWRRSRRRSCRPGPDPSDCPACARLSNRGRSGWRRGVRVSAAT